MILYDGGPMHDPQWPEGCWGDRNGEDAVMPWWTAQQIEQAREGMARWQASARLEPIPTEDQCVNFGGA